MGAYLSEPDKKLYLVEGSTDTYDFAAGSMRGWRVSNEDAHSCSTDFDKDTSLFAVFDGHGGSEVAECAAKQLPDFIKNHELYKKGDYEKALEHSFVDFDKFLLNNNDLLVEIKKRSDEINEDYKHLPDDHKVENEPGSSSNANGESSIVEDVDTETLRREAKVPIEQLMNQYCNKKTRKLFSQYFNSPLITKKTKNDPEDSDAIPSTSSGSNDGPGPSNSDEPSSSKADDQDEPQTNLKKFMMRSANQLSELMTLDVDEDADDEEDSEFNSDYNESNEDGDDEDDDEDDVDKEGPSKHSRKHRTKKIVEDFDQSDSDENNDEEDGDESSSHGEEDDDDEESSSEEETITIPYASHGKPGYDSGCTAVVTLIKKNKLYVASAGDSRCIVIKKDKYIPMSYDHKPTDKPEIDRIEKAGGQVVDGRVNGGLNLSRALGDFSYKNPDAKPEDQMISPVPDVKQIDLTSDAYEYVVVACDGIWNSMENEELSNFIYKTAPTCNGDLTELIREVFKACLAPSTKGDGTGCDNMTCIILRFKTPTNQIKENSGNDIKSDVTNNEAEQKEQKSSPECNLKRSHEIESINNVPMKRKCIDL